MTRNRQLRLLRAMTSYSGRDISGTRVRTVLSQSLKGRNVKWKVSRKPDDSSSAVLQKKKKKKRGLKVLDGIDGQGAH